MDPRPTPTPTVEEVEESLTEGDDYPARRRPGSARAAFAHRDFRRMWIGSFASNIGTWMQTVVLGSYAYRLTGSASAVAVLTFAQLGPLLLLSIVGGYLADAVDRKRLLVGLQAVQALLALALAAIVAAIDQPSMLLLFAVVLGIGVANALNAPAWSAVLPHLVGREDLPGAISLNSTMINGTRVVGPAIAGVLYPLLGAAAIFAINAATYLAVIVALLLIHFPDIPRTAETGLARLTGGFRAARAQPVVGRILVVLPLFSFFCLPFIGLFPAIVEKDMGLDSKTLVYGLLYACFGLGAMVGSLSIGTVFVGVDKRLLVRVGFAGFAVMLFVFGLLDSPHLAFPVVFVLGAFYFGSTTSMLTVLQTTVADDVRGRVMALWFMGFGGTVSLAGLAFGPILDRTNGTVVLTVGAVVAAFLAWWVNLRKLEADQRVAGAVAPRAA
jgi:MFS family permease